MKICKSCLNTTKKGDFCKECGNELIDINKYEEKKRKSLILVSILLFVSIATLWYFFNQSTNCECSEECLNCLGPGILAAIIGGISIITIPILLIYLVINLTTYFLIIKKNLN